jgi:hypothetical protein
MALRLFCVEATSRIGDNLNSPYRKVAEFQQGQRKMIGKPIPAWLKSAIP